MSGYEVRVRKLRVGHEVRVVEPRLIRKARKTKLRRRVLSEEAIDRVSEELLDAAEAKGLAQKNLRDEWRRKRRQAVRRRRRARRRWLHDHAVPSRVQTHSTRTTIKQNERTGGTSSTKTTRQVAGRWLGDG